MAPQAVAHEATTAVRAAPAGRDARDAYHVPDGDGLDVRAELDYLAQFPAAGDQTGLHLVAPFV